MTVTDETSLVLLPAMNEELIIPVESVSAKSTQRVTSKTTLVHVARNVISLLHVLIQVLVRK